MGSGVLCYLRRAGNWAPGADRVQASKGATKAPLESRCGPSSGGPDDFFGP